jgi:hypothetical protein
MGNFQNHIQGRKIDVAARLDGVEYSDEYIALGMPGHPTALVAISDCLLLCEGRLHLEEPDQSCSRASLLPAESIPQHRIDGEHQPGPRKQSSGQ